MLENTDGAINKDNPEKLATYGTQDTGILENTEEVIKKRTIQRQLWVHKTQDK
jgi:hypothetical protein